VKYSLRAIIGLFVVLYAVITALFFFFYRELALKDARQEAVFILDTMNAMRDYIDSVQRPLINKLKEENKLDNDFFDSKLLSSSYITEQVYKIQLAKKNINYHYKLVAQSPLNPEHTGNDFELGILEQLQSGERKEYASIISEDHKTYFFVGLPISQNKPSCLECHTDSKKAPPKMIDKYKNLSNFDDRVGDIMGMLTLKIPVLSIIKYHVEEFVAGGIAMLLVFIVFIILIYKIHKKEMRLQEKTEMLFISQNRLASMGEMIGNISHQWRQPLAQVSSILINLELHSERDKLTKEKLTQKIKEANEQLQFMSSTIDDFKNFFQPNKHKSEFSAQSVITQAKRLLSASLERYTIALHVIIEEDFKKMGHPNEIVQVLVNIINNAKEAFIAHKTSSRTITIKAFVQNGIDAITISNNAGRIDEAVIDKIFDPYFTTKESSSGLGLYMSKMIIEKNNGKLCVENTDEGVMFTIIF
jgi:signal transduction histidine kinase